MTYFFVVERFLFIFYCCLSPFSLITPMHPNHPHSPPLILSSLGFVHVPFVYQVATLSQEIC